jgi:hypothetical protein
LLDENTSPLCSCFTNSCKLQDINNIKYYVRYQLKLTAHTGNPQPNISTTFIGKSKPEEDV